MLHVQLSEWSVTHTHSLMVAVIVKESKPVSSSEGPGGSAVLHLRPLSKPAPMCNSCVQGKQTDMSQCLHTHLCPYSHRRTQKNALIQITYVETSVPLRAWLLSSTAHSCVHKRFSEAPCTRINSQHMLSK